VLGLKSAAQATDYGIEALNPYTFNKQ